MVDRIADGNGAKRPAGVIMMPRGMRATRPMSFAF